MNNRKDKPTLIYVRSPISEEAAKLCVGRLKEDLNIEIKGLDSIYELFPHLSDPSFNPTTIVINVEDFYQIKGVDVFDIVNTLSTLIKCTVYRENNKTKRRATEVIAIVGDTTDPNLIKGIMSIPNVHLGMRLGGTFTYDDIKADVERYFFEKNFETPKKILDLLKPKKTKKIQQSNTILLTPRQSQILSLITSRGASNKVIARILNLSESTVKLHMSSIFKKYGVRNRTQLAVFAQDSNRLTENKNV